MNTTYVRICRVGRISMDLHEGFPFTNSVTSGVRSDKQDLRLLLQFQPSSLDSCLVVEVDLDLRSCARDPFGVRVRVFQQECR